MSEASTYVYVSYIRTTPEKLWAMLTTPDFIKEYWFGMNAESDFRKGSSWTLKHADGRVFDSGEVLEADPPRRLVLKWRHELTPELKAEGYSRCSFELESADGAVKLTITHAIDVPNAKLIGAVSGGWPKVISNLKSLAETGEIALGQPYPAR
ncbi:MAG TPA: SRPBCC family protein [Caulobacterales bacterium]|nr:SRPBCC family protein [Caulobacterales bacterium]